MHCNFQHIQLSERNITWKDRLIDTDDYRMFVISMRNTHVHAGIHVHFHAQAYIHTNIPPSIASKKSSLFPDRIDSITCRWDLSPRKLSILRETRGWIAFGSAFRPSNIITRRSSISRMTSKAHLNYGKCDGISNTWINKKLSSADTLVIVQHLHSM